MKTQVDLLPRIGFLASAMSRHSRCTLYRQTQIKLATSQAALDKNCFAKTKKGKKLAKLKKDKQKKTEKTYITDSVSRD